MIMMLYYFTGQQKTNRNQTRPLCVPGDNNTLLPRPIPFTTLLDSDRDLGGWLENVISGDRTRLAGWRAD